MLSKICDNCYPDPDRTIKTLEGLRVLVVDDNDDSLELLRIILEEYGTQVTTVTSADEALEAIAQLKPALLLSDLAMPLVDGYSLVRRIRSLPPEQGGLTPAIALTAYTGEAERTLSLNCGFQKHFTKPVDPDELVSAIAELAGCPQYEDKVA